MTTQPTRLSPTDFLTSLTSLFTNTTTANHGSVFLTQKPLFPISNNTSEENPSTTDDDTTGALAPQILIRATNGAATPKKHHTKTQAKKLEGKRVKISTVVEVGEAEDFFAKLAECCKGGMAGLRKRERKKKAKGKKGKGGVGK